MKNIVVGFFTLIVVALMVWTASKGGAYHGGEHGKVIEDIGDRVNTAQVIKPKEKDDREKEQDALNALKDKAGNIASFSVSKEYKSKCASCHGSDGSGYQNGRKMMGPKLFGQTEAKIYKDLVDFKASRKENVIMKGLLINLDDVDLKRLAKEIGEFPVRASAKK